MRRLPILDDGSARLAGCGGECCTRFTLPFGPEVIRRSVEMARLQSVGFPVKVPEGSQARLFNDLHFWAPHLIYLGEHDWYPNGGEVKPGERFHHYTCALFDTTHRLCKLYEHRPDTCRKYPERKCLYVGCEWDAAREGKVWRGEPHDWDALQAQVDGIKVSLDAAKVKG